MDVLHYSIQIYRQRMLKCVADDNEIYVPLTE